MPTELHYLEEVEGERGELRAAGYKHQHRPVESAGAQVLGLWENDLCLRTGQHLKLGGHSEQGGNVQVEMLAESWL